MHKDLKMINILMNARELGFLCIAQNEDFKALHAVATETREVQGAATQ